MYKVVLVDDEARIVEGLSKLIPWDEYQCEVVATASDIITATNIIKEHNPHILFTDIRMPDGNGLNMLAGLRSEHPDMEVTVLTGFKEFDYAQKAISLGVTRFVLKPSRMEELLDALSVMTGNLKNRSEHDHEETKNLADNNSAEPQEEDYVNSFVVREAIEFIQKNYDKKINLSDVADACYVSQWHLSKLLSKNTGQNFYEILNTARISEAKKLLNNPSLRIGEISEMVGYSDTPHFSRVFKKMEGISPNEYRNSGLA